MPAEQPQHWACFCPAVPTGSEPDTSAHVAAANATESGIMPSRNRDEDNAARAFMDRKGAFIMSRCIPGPCKIIQVHDAARPVHRTVRCTAAAARIPIVPFAQMHEMTRTLNVRRCDCRLNHHSRCLLSPWVPAENKNASVQSRSTDPNSGKVTPAQGSRGTVRAFNP